MKLKYTISLILIIILSGASLKAQFSHDTTRTMGRRNIVRINPTPSALVGFETFVLGYERVLSPHQSVSINIGSLRFTHFQDLGLSRFGINSNRVSGGYSIALDYRRYFKNRNRGLAPDGLYWGPYFVYYTYDHTLNLSYTEPNTNVKSFAQFDANFNMYHFGVELGYQFIIAKRLAIDLVLVGPSWGKYEADFELSGNVSTEDATDLFDAIYDQVVEKYPAAATFLDEKKLTTSGHISSNTFGMRYLVQIGFLF